MHIERCFRISFRVTDKTYCFNQIQDCSFRVQKENQITLLSNVSHYSQLIFVLNICTKLAPYLQFMVPFVGIVHIFMFGVILYIRYFNFVNQC